jgi:hypothetical protein
MGSLRRRLAAAKARLGSARARFAEARKQLDSSRLPLSATKTQLGLPRTRLIIPRKPLITPLIRFFIRQLEPGGSRTHVIIRKCALVLSRARLTGAPARFNFRPRWLGSDQFGVASRVWRKP